MHTTHGPSDDWATLHAPARIWVTCAGGWLAKDPLVATYERDAAEGAVEFFRGDFLSYARQAREAAEAEVRRCSLDNARLTYRLGRYEGHFREFYEFAPRWGAVTDFELADAYRAGREAVVAGHASIFAPHLRGLRNVLALGAALAPKGNAP